jgi:MFS family permease
MKIDLAGPKRRGLAMGLNEAAGYVAVSLAALASGYVAAAYSMRPHPFYLGIVFAVAGLLLTLFTVRDTSEHARLEATDWADTESRHVAAKPVKPSFARVLLLTSWKDRALFSVSQAGMVNNLNDGLAWGLFPLYFGALGLSVARIGVLVALYPAVWGLGQLVTGPLSDKLGRKPLIVGGMFVQAAGIGILLAGDSFSTLAAGMILLGCGTALVYPTLLAAIGDVAHPSWRASSVGVYRLWRDGGYVVGALVAGLLADLLGMTWAIGSVAAITAASGIVVLLVMYETMEPGPIVSRPTAAAR